MGLAVSDIKVAAHVYENTVWSRNPALQWIGLGTVTAYPVPRTVMIVPVDRSIRRIT